MASDVQFMCPGCDSVLLQQDTVEADIPSETNRLHQIWYCKTETRRFVLAKTPPRWIELFFDCEKISS
jgi:hypothetical protein